MFFGGLFAGWLLDRVGRRLSLAFACVVSIGGVSAQYVAGRPVVFLVGKMVTGFSLGKCQRETRTYTYIQKEGTKR
jgi:MFS family permease